MEIKTYTNLWSMEKKLYSIYDFSLPAPISLRAVAIFIGVGIPWMGLMAFIGVPFTPPWFLIYLVIPGVTAWFGSKPYFEGKNLFQYLGSRAKHLFESKKYKSLEPVQDDKNVTYKAELVIWQKKP